MCFDPVVQLFSVLANILFAAFCTLYQVYHPFGVACHGGPILKHSLVDLKLHKIAFVVCLLQRHGFTNFLFGKRVKGYTLNCLNIGGVLYTKNP